MSSMSSETKGSLLLYTILNFDGSKIGQISHVSFRHLTRMSLYHDTIRYTLHKSP